MLEFLSVALRSDIERFDIQIEIGHFHSYFLGLPAVRNFYIPFHPRIYHRTHRRVILVVHIEHLAIIQCGLQNLQFSRRKFFPFDLFLLIAREFECVAF